MKKIILSLFAGLALAACTNQQEQKTSRQETADTAALAANGAAFAFDEVTYDFGTVTAGEKVTHEYTFTNSGSNPLIISDAEASCGCTIPEFPKEPIAPGEQGKIKVVFNSAGRFGKQNKVITITSNTEPSKTELFLTGEVKEEK